MRNWKSYSNLCKNETEFRKEVEIKTPQTEEDQKDMTEEVNTLTAMLNSLIKDIKSFPVSYCTLQSKVSSDGDPSREYRIIFTLVRK